jgi:hypothetical protein
MMYVTERDTAGRACIGRLNSKGWVAFKDSESAVRDSVITIKDIKAAVKNSDNEDERDAALTTGEKSYRISKT